MVLPYIESLNYRACMHLLMYTDEVGDLHAGASQVTRSDWLKEYKMK